MYLFLRNDLTFQAHASVWVFGGDLTQTLVRVCICETRKSTRGCPIDTHGRFKVWFQVNSYFSQFGFKSIRSDFGQIVLIDLANSHSFGNSTSLLGQLVLIVVNSYSFWSLRFGKYRYTERKKETKKKKKNRCNIWKFKCMIKPYIGVRFQTLGRCTAIKMQNLERLNIFDWEKILVRYNIWLLATDLGPDSFGFLFCRT